MRDGIHMALRSRSHSDGIHMRSGTPSRSDSQSPVAPHAHRPSCPPPLMPVGQLVSSQLLLLHTGLQLSLHH
jgi:hypothetical protein